MFIIDEDTGTITLRQGDSAELSIENIPEDREYTVYFSIYDISRNIVLELSGTPEEGNITFALTPANTQLLSVPVNQKTATYYWAVKRCYEPDNFEDTLLVGDKGVADVNKVVVYPLVAEGAENAS